MELLTGPPPGRDPPGSGVSGPGLFRGENRAPAVAPWTTQASSNRVSSTAPVLKEEANAFSKASVPAARKDRKPWFGPELGGEQFSPHPPLSDRLSSKKARDVLPLAP